MPRRGRTPKPAELKKVQGNPGKRKAVKVEASTLQAGAIAAPKYLSKAERVIWDSQIALLDHLKFVRPSDVRALGRYVKFQAMFEAAAPMVTPSKLIERTVSDKVEMDRLSKYFLALLHLDKRLLAYDAEFGQTPAARQSIMARLAARAPQLPLDQPKPADQKVDAGGVAAPTPAKPSPVGFGRLN